MRVGLRDFDRVMRLLPELYRCRAIDALLHDAVRLLAPLISCDGCGWFIYTFDRGPRLAALSESEPVLTPELLPRLADLAPSHPFVDIWPTRRLSAPLTYSDVPRLALDRMFVEHPVASRALGTDALTAPISMTRARWTAFSFRRERGRFSDDDRVIHWFASTPSGARVCECRGSLDDDRRRRVSVDPAS